MGTLSLQIKRDDNVSYLEGNLDIYHYSQAREALANISKTKIKIIDLSKISKLDTTGALILRNAKKDGYQLKNLSDEYQALFDIVSNLDLTYPTAKKHQYSLKTFIINLGKAFIDFYHSSLELISFLGQSIISSVRLFKHPASINLSSIAFYIKSTGIAAIPLISIISFVISIVIAYQGQVQLRPLGAQRYTIDLVVISILREMGVLLTAIMVAGRSGSNFTAEIGVMKLRQEIDALRTIGFNPFELLILPRIFGLIIILPLLTILADIMGLLGGAIISISLIDINLAEYLERAHNAARWEDFLVGLIKAPVFALVIALVGSMHGLKVSGSSQSVGKETTISVVKSIFLILILDGLFSIYFYKVGL